MSPLCRLLGHKMESEAFIGFNVTDGGHLELTEMVGIRCARCPVNEMLAARSYLIGEYDQVVSNRRNDGE